jgi:Fe-S-cluster-containing hydrogenase component 2
VEGSWFKLICGASFQDLPDVRNLVLAYTLAGADCIDVAADPAVVAAAKEAIEVAKTLTEQAINKGFGVRGVPWLMVSLNDGEDPHFRKAGFDATQCPTDCFQPCLRVCPTEAIQFSDRGETELNSVSVKENPSGVIDRRCYGCGRCLPVCPSQLIVARSYVSAPTTIAPLIQEMEIDAIEIHTKVGHERDFKRLWKAIAPLCDRLKLLAISCPDDPEYIDYLHTLYEAIAPLPCLLVWQTDGRPMSGDIGAGTTHAAIELAQKVLAAGLPGYVQLAGGTNHYTVPKLKAAGLLKAGNIPTTNISGIAYGGYARSLLLPIIKELETSKCQITQKTFSDSTNSNLFENRLENNRILLWQAVTKADALVSQIKFFERTIAPEYLGNRIESILSNNH